MDNDVLIINNLETAIAELDRLLMVLLKLLLKFLDLFLSLLFGQH